MGQKINPIIFRLGVNKTWKTEFFEKKEQELPLYVFKDLEIRTYIERIFETYGIILHNYKQHYNGSTLNLYISYFITSDFVLDRKENSKKLILLNEAKERKMIKVLSNKSTKPSTFSFNKPTQTSLSYDSSRIYKLKNYLNTISHDLLKGRRTEEFIPVSKVSDGIFCQIFKVLTLFNKNRINIVLNFSCANKDLFFLKFTHDKVFMSLQKFRNTPFLKEGVELLFHVAYNSNSANLLAKFIAMQLKRVKRHKFFLSFIKQTLSLLVSSTSSRIKGVKIAIKGRLNGVPRASQKILTIGDVPVQSISANLDYSQVTMHNSNGSYGIKVWIVEK